MVANLVINSVDDTKLPRYTPTNATPQFLLKLTHFMEDNYSTKSITIEGFSLIILGGVYSIHYERLK